jgi:hypothetical protein
MRVIVAGLRAIVAGVAGKKAGRDIFLRGGIQSGDWIGC